MAKKFKKLPNHIAFIMDGNRRWAKKRGLPRSIGHNEGIKAIAKTVDACLKYNIKYCTFFAFSTENWKREKAEIDYIFNLVKEYLSKNEEYFMNKGIKLTSIGNLAPLPEDLKLTLKNVKRKTAKNNKLILTVALNYGGRDEVVRAIKRTIRSKRTDIDEKLLLSKLDTKYLPEPDLLIRTSGEQRLSNFMLIQMAYTELYFTKTYWPDFNEKELVKALKEYQKRERRFGGTK